MSETEPTAPPKLPSAAEVLRNVTPVTSERLDQTKFLEETEDQAIRAQVQYEHLRGLHDHYTHKGRWSGFLIFLMFGLIFFQSLLLGLVGGGVWDFTKYEWLLPALLVQNLAQVIGLAFVVVKSLFR